MPLDDQTMLRIEEYKEIGHEYRYREQLMVQEFGFSMLTTGVVIGAIFTSSKQPVFALILQFFGMLFLALIWLHLRNINDDRRAALDRKEEIRKSLNFEQIHQGVSGRARPFITASAPRSMVRFAKLATIVWAIWVLWSAALIVCPLLPHSN